MYEPFQMRHETFYNLKQIWMNTRAELMVYNKSLYVMFNKKTILLAGDNLGLNGLNAAQLVRTPITRATHGLPPSSSLLPLSVQRGWQWFHLLHWWRLLPFIKLPLYLFF